MRQGTIIAIRTSLQSEDILSFVIKGTEEFGDRVAEVGYNQLFNIIAKTNDAISNAKIEEGKIKFIGGTQKRYTDLSKTIENAPLVVLNKINHQGNILYELCDYNGNTQLVDEEMAAVYMQRFGIANGKIFKRGDSTVISPIEGEYPTRCLTAQEIENLEDIDTYEKYTNDCTNIRQTESCLQIESDKLVDKLGAQVMHMLHRGMPMLNKKQTKEVCNLIDSNYISDGTNFIEKTLNKHNIKFRRIKIENQSKCVSASNYDNNIEYFNFNIQGEQDKDAEQVFAGIIGVRAFSYDNYTAKNLICSCVMTFKAGKLIDGYCDVLKILENNKTFWVLDTAPLETRLTNITSTSRKVNNTELEERITKYKKSMELLEQLPYVLDNPNIKYRDYPTDITDIYIKELTRLLDKNKIQNENHVKILSIYSATKNCDIEANFGHESVSMSVAEFMGAENTPIETGTLIRGFANGVILLNEYSKIGNIRSFVTIRQIDGDINDKKIKQELTRLAEDKFKQIFGTASLSNSLNSKGSLLKFITSFGK